MIEWFTGNTGAGKTTAATKRAKKLRAILLDGDRMRELWPELDHSKESRVLNTRRIAHLAKELDVQGFTVIVAAICPYNFLQEEVVEKLNCKLIYVQGGKEASQRYPYEIPKNPDRIIKSQ